MFSAEYFRSPIVHLLYANWEAQALFWYASGSEIDAGSARYAIRTNNGAFVYVENIGIRHGRAEAMEKLRRGEHAEPSLICFRTAPCFETAAELCVRLTWYLFVAEGMADRTA